MPGGCRGGSPIDDTRRGRAGAAAALLDALMQGSDAARLEKAVLEPLRDARTERRRSRAEKATATKVDFFTMARGDD